MKALSETTERIKNYQNLINLLQKNGNLNYLGEYKKCIAELEINQEALVKLDEFFKKDFSQAFKEKENQRNTLLNNLNKIVGLLSLAIQRSKTKKEKDKTDFLNEKLDNSTDKHLLKVTRKTIMLANKEGSYSITALNNISAKKISKQFRKAQDITSNFGLTSEMVKQLEEAATAFMKSMITVESIVDEKQKTTKKIKKLFDRNEKILEKRIDKLIDIYEKPGSAFMNAYSALQSEQIESEKFQPVLSGFSNS